MIEKLILIRDILMCAGGVIGTVMICYVRVSFSSRQQKTSEALQYNEKEIKLRKIAIAILAVTLLLAMIPTRYL